jgi:amidase
LGALTGEDPRDKTTTQSRGKAHTDYTRFLDKNGLNGMRIGVARKNLGFNKAVDELIQRAKYAMGNLGASFIDPADIPTTGKFDDSEFEVLLYEFKADLNAYLASLGATTTIRSLKELIVFNESKAEFEMPYFGQDIFEKAQAKGPLTDIKYRQALRRNHLLTRTQGIDFIMKKHRLDAMMAATGGPPWPTDLINGDHFSGGYSSASAVAGYPHITVPAGYVYGLPVGVSFFGGAYSEPTLIKAAYAFEQATKARHPPKFLPTVDFSKDD